MNLYNYIVHVNKFHQFGIQIPIIYVESAIHGKKYFHQCKNQSFREKIRDSIFSKKTSPYVFNHNDFVDFFILLESTYHPHHILDDDLIHNALELAFLLSPQDLVTDRQFYVT